MANISAEITAFRNAVYGEDVRSAMVSLANKLNNIVTDGVASLNIYYKSLWSVNNNAGDIHLLNYQNKVINNEFVAVDDTKWVLAELDSDSFRTIPGNIMIYGNKDMPLDVYFFIYNATTDTYNSVTSGHVYPHLYPNGYTIRIRSLDSNEKLFVNYSIRTTPKPTLDYKEAAFLKITNFPYIDQNITSIHKALYSGTYEDANILQNFEWTVGKGFSNDAIIGDSAVTALVSEPIYIPEGSRIQISEVIPGITVGFIGRIAGSNDNYSVLRAYSAYTRYIFGDDPYEIIFGVLTNSNDALLFNGLSILDYIQCIIVDKYELPYLDWKSGYVMNYNNRSQTSNKYTTTRRFKGNGKKYLIVPDSGYKITIQEWYRGDINIICGLTSNPQQLTFKKDCHYMMCYSGEFTTDPYEPLTITKIDGGGGEPSALAGTTQRFTVSVNCNKFDSDSITLNLQDDYDPYNDYAMIMLPDTYTDDGSPTRLVISCHGAGGTVSTDDSQVERQVTTKYLVANGYAVMDCNGLPFDYADQEGISRLNNIGSPIAVSCYAKAYKYCMDHFNLFEKVFMFGASMGGISSTNVVMSGIIPVAAHGAYCPVLDTYNEIWLHPWSSGLPKTAMIKFYNFDQQDGNYVYDESKLIGYNPVNHNTTVINGDKYTIYPCPVKFWHCVDDGTVSYQVTQAFVEAINRAGCTAYLRSLPSGGHQPQDAGDPISSPSGNTTFRGESLASSITPAIEEVFLWFERWNK